MSAASHVTDQVAQQAAGAIEAQAVLRGLQDGRLSTDHAWLGFVQVAARFGRSSPAARAFVVELAKRAAE